MFSPIVASNDGVAVVGNFICFYVGFMCKLSNKFRIPNVASNDCGAVDCCADVGNFICFSVVVLCKLSNKFRIPNVASNDCGAVDFICFSVGFMCKLSNKFRIPNVASNDSCASFRCFNEFSTFLRGGVFEANSFFPISRIFFGAFPTTFAVIFAAFTILANMPVFFSVLCSSFRISCLLSTCPVLYISLLIDSNSSIVLSNLFSSFNISLSKFGKIFSE